MSKLDGPIWNGSWGTPDSNPLDDIRAMRDIVLADYSPSKHVPGCVLLDGEWLCSPFCRVKRGAA